MVVVCIALAATACTPPSALYGTATPSNTSATTTLRTEPTPGISTSAAASAARRTVWHPHGRVTWQWQITGNVGTLLKNVTMYDVDLQDAVPTQRVVHVRGF